MRDKIIACGRRLQSAQTGFVHLQDTIPMVENFLFALALFRSHTSEQMLEGKEIVNRLLPFQSEEGNFPLFLHDFPNCKELFCAAKVLPPLYWLVKDYGSLLGEPVKSAAKKVVNYCLKHVSQAPDHIAILIAGGAPALGRLLGMEVEDELEKFHNPAYWYSPTLLGTLLIALQMRPELHWEDFRRHLSETWHQGCYAAPHLYDPRYQTSPFAHLHQIYMQGGEPNLYAALIKPAPLDPPLYPVFKSGPLFQFTQSETEASYVSSQGIPYQLLFSAEGKQHRLRLRTEGKVEKRGEQLLITHAKEGQELFSLELDTCEGTAIWMNGKRSVVFHLGDEIEFLSRKMKITLQSGSGEVMGHLSMGPPSADFGRKWLLTIRPIALSSDVVLAIE